MKMQNCYHAITSSLREITQEMETPSLPCCDSEVVQLEAGSKCGPLCCHLTH